MADAAPTAADGTPPLQLPPPQPPERPLQPAAAADPEAICRVCRSHATPDDPLFHPCRCSGSMKFIHQVCLEEWLAHSGKKDCEICNHPFVFTPIYAQEAPPTVSILLVAKVLLARIAANIRLGLRVMLASFLWLIWVPFVTVITWRVFLGPSTLLERWQHSPEMLPTLLFRYYTDRSFAESTSILDIWAQRDWAAEYTALFSMFMSDVFEGQRIALIAIVIGLAAVFVKEYIVLNTGRDAAADAALVDEDLADDEFVDEEPEAEEPVDDEPVPTAPPNPAAADPAGPENLVAEDVVLPDAARLDAPLGDRAAGPAEADRGSSNALPVHQEPLLPAESADIPREPTTADTEITALLAAPAAVASDARQIIALEPRPTSSDDASAANHQELAPVPISSAADPKHARPIALATTDEHEGPKTGDAQHPALQAYPEIASRASPEPLDPGSATNGTVDDAPRRQVQTFPGLLSTPAEASALRIRPHPMRASLHHAPPAIVQSPFVQRSNLSHLEDVFSQPTLETRTSSLSWQDSDRDLLRDIDSDLGSGEVDRPKLSRLGQSDMIASPDALVAPESPLLLVDRRHSFTNQPRPVFQPAQHPHLQRDSVDGTPAASSSAAGQRPSLPARSASFRGRSATLFLSSSISSADMSASQRQSASELPSAGALASGRPSLEPLLLRRGSVVSSDGAKSTVASAAAGTATAVLPAAQDDGTDGDGFDEPNSARRLSGPRSSTSSTSHPSSPGSPGGHAALLLRQDSAADSVSSVASSERLIVLPKAKTVLPPDVPKYVMRGGRAAQRTVAGLGSASASGSGADSGSSLFGGPSGPGSTASGSQSLSESSKIDELRARYAAEMAMLESEVDRRKVKAKHAPSAPGSRESPVHGSASSVGASLSDDDAAANRAGHMHRRQMLLDRTARRSKSFLHQHRPAHIDAFADGRGSADGGTLSSTHSARGSVSSVSSADWQDSIANLRRTQNELSSELRPFIITSQRISADSAPAGSIGGDLDMPFDGDRTTSVRARSGRLLSMSDIDDAGAFASQQSVSSSRFAGYLGTAGVTKWSRSTISSASSVGQRPVERTRMQSLGSREFGGDAPRPSTASSSMSSTSSPPPPLPPADADDAENGFIPPADPAAMRDPQDPAVDAEADVALRPHAVAAQAGAVARPRPAFLGAPPDPVAQRHAEALAALAAAAAAAAAAAPPDVARDVPAPAAPGGPAELAGEPAEAVELPAADADAAVENAVAVVEVNANGDITAFLDMVGITGRISTLFFNIMLVHILVIFVIGIGVGIPSLTGTFIMWIIKDVYLPIVEDVVVFMTFALQKVTDPIIDPIVDGIFAIGEMLSLDLHGILGSAISSIVAVNATAVDSLADSASTALSSSVMPSTTADAAARAALTVSSALAASATSTAAAISSTLASTLAATTGLAGTPEAALAQATPSIDLVVPALAPGFESSLIKSMVAKKVLNPVGTALLSPKSHFQTLADELMRDPIVMAVVGYTVYALLFLLYASRNGLLDHPYARTARRLVQKLLRNIAIGHKFMFFVFAELGVFPIFCGALIDVCTLPVFGKTATIASRLAFFNNYPYTSMFLHWLAGTTFMFQIAVYINAVREVLRPGVMWFIRDPNDPRFNPMHDIMHKPLLKQLHKIAVGAVLYAGLIFGVVGGTVGAILGLQWLLGVSTGPYMFLPLRWEFHDRLSEVPFDLLIFHYLVPSTIKFLKPRAMFKAFLEDWFTTAAAMLRMSSFLIGGEYPDEEAPDAPVELIDVATQVDPSELGEAPASEEAASVEPTGELPDAAGAEPAPPMPPRGPRVREMRYLRVPNHDHIEAIPGQPMMVPMHEEDLVFGRENESPEEVAINWTKVYVPDGFRVRVLALLAAHWISVVFVITLALIMPLHTGRLAFEIIHKLTVVHIELPRGINYQAPQTTRRPDLRVHDFYSFVAGLLICYAFASVAAFVRRALRLGSRLARRNAVRRRRRRGARADADGRRARRRVRRQAGGNNAPAPAVEAAPAAEAAVEDAAAAPDNAAQPADDDALAADTPDSDASDAARPAPADETPPREARATFAGQALRWIALWWSRYGRYDLERLVKGVYLVFWVGLVLPLVVGIAMDVFVNIAIKSGSHSEIMFVAQDWCIGFMAIKVAHTMVMAGPDTELKRMLVRATRDGLRMQLRPITMRIIVPIVSCSAILCGLCYSVMFFSAAAVHWLELPVSPFALRNNIMRALIALLITAAFAFDLLRKLRDGVVRLIQRIRDDQYLVGRRLHNVDEIPHEALGAQAAPAQ